MLKTDKERVVADLAERLRSSETLLLADYRGLTMKEIDALRGEILGHGARFSVVKNSLTRRAAEEAGITELHEFLDGPTAIAFVGEGDMVAVAKTLDESARKTRILALKGGILQGRPITADQVRDLASLPPMEALRGQMLGGLVAPLYALVGLLTAPLRDLAAVMDARVTQLEAGGGAPAESADPAEPPATDAGAEPAESNEIDQQPKTTETEDEEA